MKEIRLIFQGMLIGLGKVIPGVSGSLIAISLGVYEHAMDAIGHFFKNWRDNLIFLGTLAIGLVISIALGSKALIYLLEFCYIPTMLLFIGFISGVFPSLTHKVRINKKTLLIFLLSTLFVFLLNCNHSSSDFYPKQSFSSYLLIFGIGFLDATTMIIPGISGTAIFMILGCYGFVLDLFASMSNVTEFVSHFLYFCFFGAGLFFGVILVSKGMSYCLKKYRDFTYALVMGFTFSSILVLIQKVFTTNGSLIEYGIGFFLFLIGYKLSIRFGD